MFQICSNHLTWQTCTGDHKSFKAFFSKLQHSSIPMMQTLKLAFPTCMWLQSIWLRTGLRADATQIVYSWDSWDTTVRDSQLQMPELSFLHIHFNRISTAYRTPTIRSLRWNPTPCRRNADINISKSESLEWYPAEKNPNFPATSLSANQVVTATSFWVSALLRSSWDQNQTNTALRS